MSDSIPYTDTRGRERDYPHSFSLDDLEKLAQFILERPSATMWDVSLAGGHFFTGIRHDVDHSIDHAIRFARWEASLGIESTYFLLPTAHYWRAGGIEEKVRELEGLCHEVGYHHDSLTEAAVGNLSPRGVFESHLLDLRSWSGEGIVGCAAHGGELGHNNLEFWNDNKPEDFDLLYEAYHLNQGCHYVSDNRGMFKNPPEHVEGQATRLLVHPEHWRLPEEI